MFDGNFTFGAESSRSASLDSASSGALSSRSRSVSPCSAQSAYPQPQFTVTDLAASFGRSRLRQEAQICYDACAAYAATDDDAGWQIDEEPVVASIETDGALPRSSGAAARLLRARAHSPTRRVQRQSNGRLLCSTAHHKDIAALVGRMVARKDQCSVAAARSSSSFAADPTAAALMVPATPADEDEGYDSSEYFDPPTPRSRTASAVALQRHRGLEYRRSSEFKSTTGACVNKAIRLRKDRAHSRRKLEV